VLFFYSEKYCLVYLGRYEERHLFTNPDDLGAPIQRYMGDIQQLSSSFNSILTHVEFVRIKGSDSIGTAKGSASLKAAINPVLLLILFAPCLVGVIHGLSYPVVSHLELSDSDSLPIDEALALLLSGWGLDWRQIGLGELGVLALLYFNRNKRSSAPLKREIPLPSDIVSGKFVPALPLKMTRLIHYSDSAEDTDTGRRIIDFKIDKGFVQAVYLQLTFDRAKHPTLEKLVECHIEQSLLMNVRISDELKLEAVFD